MRMKTVIVPVIMALLLVFPVLASASGIIQDVENFTGKENVTSWHLLGAKAASIAMEQLSFTKGDENVLAMTNAGYAIINGQTTEKCIDGVTAVSGCTVGKGNLLLIHRSKEKPLWFAFFKKDTKELVYLQVNNAVAGKPLTEINKLTDKEIFVKITKESIGLNDLLNNPGQWEEKVKNKVFEGNEFSLIGIANVWAHPKCTYDFLQVIQFHNHVCPGVNSGYLIIKYLDKMLPLQPGQEYKIIACPPWCKDDAFQVILDTTVGKKGIYVKALTKEQEEKLPPEAKTIAGLYIRWDGKSGSGDGLALGFDFDKVRKLAGVADYSGPEWISKLKMNMELMEYLDNPETLITTLKRFKVDADELAALQAAGVNPLVEIGLMKETKGGADIVLKIGAEAATKNGKTVQLAQPAQIINDRAMVPLRFISEALGASVEWEEDTQTVHITVN
ncbi:MAG: hypothetical protein K6U04_00385 [Armatimonadetes bacterium]|nr:hypothetical protein [Armatimonadota bacterium]